MDEADLSRFAMEVLETLARAKDHDGLYIVLRPDDQIAVLAAAITAVNNMRTDVGLFRRISFGAAGEITFRE